MFPHLLVTGAVMLGALQATPPRDTSSVADIRTALDRYEQQAAQGKGDPDALAEIARRAVRRAATSGRPEAVVAACASAFATEPDCAERLWDVAKRASAPLGERAAAAAALVERKDKAAAAFLIELASKAPRERFAEVASSLVVLPAERAVPLLAARMDVEDPAATTAACRVLAHIDAGESREAVNRYLATAPKGTQPWLNCTFAAARLGDMQAMQLASAQFAYLRDFDLVVAGEVLLPAAPDMGVSLLLQATRQGRGLTPLDAADRLAAVRPDDARAVMERGLADASPEIRAAALQVHRRLEIEPSRGVRALLADPDAMVGLRAAEAVLAWDARRRKAPAAARR